MRMQTRIRHTDKPRVSKHGQGRRDFRGERAWGSVGASAGHMGTGQGIKGDVWPTRREARGDAGDGGFSMAWHEVLEKWRGNITWGVAWCISTAHGHRAGGRGSMCSCTRRARRTEMPWMQSKQCASGMGRMGHGRHASRARYGATGARHEDTRVCAVDKHARGLER